MQHTNTLSLKLRKIRAFIALFSVGFRVTTIMIDYTMLYIVAIKCTVVFVNV